MLVTAPPLVKLPAAFPRSVYRFGISNFVNQGEKGSGISMTANTTILEKNGNGFLTIPCQNPVYNYAIKLLRI